MSHRLQPASTPKQELRHFGSSVTLTVKPHLMGEMSQRRVTNIHLWVAGAAGMVGFRSFLNLLEPLIYRHRCDFLLNAIEVPVFLLLPIAIGTSIGNMRLAWWLLPVLWLSVAAQTVYPVVWVYALVQADVVRPFTRVVYWLVLMTLAILLAKDNGTTESA